MKTYRIYGRPGCNYCKKIVQFMIDNNKKHVYVSFSGLDDKLQEIKEKFHWKTVPIVLELEGETVTFMGGCDDTIKHLQRGELGRNPLSTIRNN